MKTEYKDVDWLLDCEPRIVQLEAISRSYTGVAYRDHKDAKPAPRRISAPRMPGYAFFMEMRTGKTNTLLNEWLLFRRDHKVNKLLVIAPNKYKYAWEREAHRFGIPDEVHVFESEYRNRAIEYVYKGGDILVVNYEALQSTDTMKVLHRFVDGSRTMIAADESVLIKNRTTHAFSNSLELTKKAAVVRILTGKPVVQGPHDLWSQLRFIRQLDNFNFYAFRNTFCKMGGFKGKQVVGAREENTPMLQQILRSCAFVAYRSQWGTSFASDYESRPIEMLPIQLRKYKEMETEFITWLDSGQAITADQVITKHIKLQQISSGFVIDEFGVAHDIVEPHKVPKLVELKDMLENEVLNKTIVICFYVHTMEALIKALAPYNPAVIGGAKMMNRLKIDVEQQKARFNSDSSCRVLIGQIQAIKYGHMLMGSKEHPCETTVYYENTYSLDDRSQSEQRNQGEGQRTGIHVVDFHSSRVEREINRALARKENIAESILGVYREGLLGRAEKSKQQKKQNQR